MRVGQLEALLALALVVHEHLCAVVYLPVAFRADFHDEVVYVGAVAVGAVVDVVYLGDDSMLSTHLTDVLLLPLLAAVFHLSTLLCFSPANHRGSSIAIRSPLCCFSVVFDGL